MSRIVDLPGEIWKPVIYRGIDYSDRYMVSNMGRIKSLYFQEKEFVCTVSKGGYTECCLCKDNNHVYTTVHRLVKEVFDPIPGMENLEVNHLDECKINNRLDNLEWVTRKQNLNYGSRNKKVGEASRKPVLCVEDRRVFARQQDAADEYGIEYGDLSNHLDGYRNIVKGKHLVRISNYFPKDHELSEDDIDYIIRSETKKIESQPKRRCGPILCVETGVVYPSQTAAAEALGIYQPTISDALRGSVKQAGGYTWKRIEDI